jgi:thioredoxin reductase (NADPH)
VTGPDLRKFSTPRETWKLNREPYYLENSMPGVFAAGDVRHGSIKRVASAVGEGAMAIAFVHRYLASG